jgi:hypothetical protein
MSFEIKPAATIYDLDDSVTSLETSVTSLTSSLTSLAPTTLLSLRGSEILDLNTNTIAVDNLHTDPNVRNNLHIHIRGVVGGSSDDSLEVRFYDENNEAFQFVMSVLYLNNDSVSGALSSISVPITNNNQYPAFVNKGIIDINILDLKDITKLKTFTGSLIKYSTNTYQGTPTVMCHGIENTYISGTNTPKNTLSKIKKIEIKMNSNSILRSVTTQPNVGFIKIVSN